MSFTERLPPLVDRVRLLRGQRNRDRMVCQAQLKLAACVADIDYQQPGNINKRQSQIAQMAQSDWLDRDQNRLITGPCGRRKTYLACAVTTACHG